MGNNRGLGHRGAVALEDLLLVPRALVDELLQRWFGIFDVEEFRRPGDTRYHRFDALVLTILK